MQVQRPTDESEVARLLAYQAQNAGPVEVVGGGSKADIGRPVEVAMQVSTKNLRGITLYEPTELVISARAGTPVATVEAELDKHNQRLMPEPIDLGPMLGQPAGLGTVGGMVATNFSGARRIYAGAVRDHVLGVRAVNGRGETFKSGGRVMKNVTGYDLCRGLTGSWGTLAILTEVTLKVLAKTEETRTLLIADQPDEIAIELLCAAMGTPYEISAAMHLPAPMATRLAHLGVVPSDRPVTALRIENVSSAIAYRVERLRKRFAPHGDLVELDHGASLSFWKAMQRLEFLVGSDDPVWRISTTPSTAANVVRTISSYSDVKVAYDWSGGLIWLELPDSADAGSADIRRVIATLGGHATLIRARPDVRRAVEVFQPLEAGVEDITRRVKASFDPAGILNPSRMYPGV